MNKSEVVYVAIPGKNNCMYPIYIPITFKEPNVYKATGRLSVNDYNDTVKNLGGFPALIPLLSMLAPMIPSIFKGVKKVFNGNGGYTSTGPYSQRGYHGLNENEYYRGGRCEGRYAGYIPTNPNIKNLKDLQALYDKYE